MGDIVQRLIGRAEELRLQATGDRDPDGRGTTDAPLLEDAVAEIVATRSRLSRALRDDMRARVLLDEAGIVGLMEDIG